MPPDLDPAGAWRTILAQRKDMRVLRRDLRDAREDAEHWRQQAAARPADVADVLAQVVEGLEDMGLRLARVEQRGCSCL